MSTHSRIGTVWFKAHCRVMGKCRPGGNLRGISRAYPVRIRAEANKLIPDRDLDIPITGYSACDTELRFFFRGKKLWMSMPLATHPVMNGQHAVLTR